LVAAKRAIDETVGVVGYRRGGCGDRFLPHNFRAPVCSWEMSVVHHLVSACSLSLVDWMGPCW
jgi:hypothetical protein